MTYTKPSSLAMTAIAAVLALSTPAMAQEVTPTPVTPVTPVNSAPPVAPPVSTITPDSEAPTTADDPLSPAATPPTPTVAATKAQPRAGSTMRATRSVNRAAPAPRRVNSAAPAPVRTRAATPPPVAPTTPVERPAATVAPLAAPIAPAAPAPAVQAAPAEIANNNNLEIAGAAGLGLLAMLGIGAAFRRRSRRAEDDRVAFEQPIEAPMAPAAFAEPAMRRDSPAVTAAAPASVGKPIAAPAASLPDGFDLSRFGAHVQAAYRGPTEDNPSLSLKHRLRRASALDQMARRDGTDLVPDVAAMAPADHGAIVSKMAAPRSSDSFMLGNGALRRGLHPVTQH